MKGRVFDEAALVMSERDNVATAVDDLDEGREFDVDGSTVRLAEAVPFGHKFALAPLDAGDEVYKYGEVIGRAMAAIEPGEWVHTHNCESTRGRGDLAAAEGGADA
ncbi:UxaA family hydrolase [Halegenticoccus soli]|uniref:UxaA family hydrolase n=1 Tax=Halegenticoccus soli TaxID=1985678 RepID=UPI000C6E27AB|nr:UxaA family hydrolase [Halegenticoccus soli]